MKVLVVLAAALAVASARLYIHPTSSLMINYINNLNTTWKVSNGYISLIVFFK